MHMHTYIHTYILACMHTYIHTYAHHIHIRIVDHEGGLQEGIHIIDIHTYIHAYTYAASITKAGCRGHAYIYNRHTYTYIHIIDMHTYTYMHTHTQRRSRRRAAEGMRTYDRHTYTHTHIHIRSVDHEGGLQGAVEAYAELLGSGGAAATPGTYAYSKAAGSTRTYMQGGGGRGEHLDFEMGDPNKGGRGDPHLDFEMGAPAKDESRPASGQGTGYRPTSRSEQANEQVGERTAQA